MFLDGGGETEHCNGLHWTWRRRCCEVGLRLKRRLHIGLPQRKSTAKDRGFHDEETTLDRGPHAIDLTLQAHICSPNYYAPYSEVRSLSYKIWLP
jgi:hypothetical protein